MNLDQSEVSSGCWLSNIRWNSTPSKEKKVTYLFMGTRNLNNGDGESRSAFQYQWHKVEAATAYLMPTIPSNPHTERSTTSDISKASSASCWYRIATIPPCPTIPPRCDCCVKCENFNPWSRLCQQWTNQTTKTANTIRSSHRSKLHLTTMTQLLRGLFAATFLAIVLFFSVLLFKRPDQPTEEREQCPFAQEDYIYWSKKYKLAWCKVPWTL